jgi:putative membrane protein
MPAALQLVTPPGVAGAGAWVFEPITTVLLALFAVAVAVGGSRARRSGLDWSPWRALSFGAGILSAILVVDAWPGVYARTLMSVFVSQQLVLLLVSPLLIAYGRPLVPLRALFPAARLPVAWSRALRVVTYPLLGPLLVPIALGVVVFTSLPTQMSHHLLVAGAVHLALVLLGFAIAAPLARDAAYASSLAFGLALSVGLVELLIDAIPGIALRLDTHVLASVTALASRRDWGPSPISDQQTAGAVLWTVAEILDLPFLLIVVLQWFRADAGEARRIDAELDRAAREAALRRPVTTAEATGARTEAADEPARDRPWWEQDASVFGDGRSRSFEADSRRRRKDI